MNIQLNKDYRLTSTESAYRLEKYSGVNAKTGQQVWQFVANWTTLDAALKSLLERQIKASGATTLGELRSAVLGAKSDLIKTCLGAIR